ncbi:unnamed protein product [Owenia fusiformis]|uniref:Proline iminopeptidase n=1 Tax=Owenia fusiformis TaxID=6347 RepID=A0A8S4N328_OWEFU|nr:unnamed protein product [Owenia fusiformis]
MTEARGLYPEIEPFESGKLKVSDVHEIYYEQSGNKNGNPVIFLHWGPGGGTSPKDRRFFDPAVYRIVLMDQRGAGKSTPAAELKDNTTWHLVEDIESLRKHLNIEKWVVFGGSWGSTMSLVYAETYPDRVKALILRGIFTARRSELLWFWQEGASNLFPDLWEKYLAPIPEVERGDLISAYYRRLTGNDEDEKLACARAWTTWEMETAKLLQDQNYLKKTENDVWTLQFARLECHYFVHGAFFKTDGQIIENADRLKDIQGVIIQGRYDVCCPVKTAWDLYKRWPSADFQFVDDAGHSETETGITALLLQATEKYKNL